MFFPVVSERLLRSAVYFRRFSITNVNFDVGLLCTENHVLVAITTQLIGSYFEAYQRYQNKRSTLLLIRKEQSQTNTQWNFTTKVTRETDLINEVTVLAGMISILSVRRI